MRFRSTFLPLSLGALCAWYGLASCPGSGGGNSNGALGTACSAPGSQSSCSSGLACKNYLDVPVPDGTQTIAVCQQTCTSNSDCNVTYTKNVCTNGFCTCTPGPVGSDACTAADPNTVCHPDYDYCATIVAPDAGSCNPGEAPTAYNGVTICRPTGAAVADGGIDAGPGTCGFVDTQGTCLWPEYCGGADGGSCVFPQNVNSVDADAPDPACNYSGGPDGTDNADQLRQSKGSAFAIPSSGNPGGPILITLSQDLTGSRCGTELGAADPANPGLCRGDGMYCGGSDDVVVFTGFAYDPGANFVFEEGNKLDAQFFAITEAGSNAGQGEALSSKDSTLASIQIGHVVPAPGNWSAVGGEFILWRCFISTGVDGGPATVTTQVGGGFVPAHYAQTTNGPGNTYCTSWAL